MSVTAFVSEGTRRMAHQLDDLLERWNLRSSSDTEERYVLAQILEVGNIRPVVKKRKLFSNASVIAGMSKLSTEELTSLRLELDTRNNDAKLQIRHFNVQASGTKDFEWLQQARNIQETYASLIQILQLESGKRKKSLKPFGDIFVEVAEEILPIDLFNKVHNLARIRYGVIKDQRGGGAK